MSARIEDYALIGNCETAALVSRDGSIDWLGLPRFDSPAVFASLLGTPENGRWLITTADPKPGIERKYRDGTLVLETRFSTSEGSVLITDCMGLSGECSEIVRLVRGESGRVAMRSELVMRFEYGSILPWVTKLDDGRLNATAGPERLTLDSPVPFEGRGMISAAEFEVSEGQEIGFVLTWSQSWTALPERASAAAVVDRVSQEWSRWSERHTTKGPWSDVVLRSLITLKALTHHRTGGIVAAATTSLPEQLGGPRNWDYRFCWLRDATFTLYSLLASGYTDEAEAWRGWLLRAIAGSPAQMQIMYGIAGERRLTEYEIPWLTGYEGASPVRIGNAASDQLQLDVFGEVLDSLYQARRMGVGADDAAWRVQSALVSHLETIWQQPDDGIWEVRGGRKHFTHSKAMAWVAFDRAVRSVEEFGVEGPVDRWREIRDQIHSEVCERGYSPELGSFVQSYGSRELDASLLLLPLVGFLPADDPRMRGTVDAIERTLLKDGFVARYNTESSVDGLPGGEGAFLACSFWLADNFTLQGRHDDARALFERLIALRNDVGLLAEEYDPRAQRLVGNFPQAFSHVALVNTAHNLSQAAGPAQHRADGDTPASL